MGLLVAMKTGQACNHALIQWYRSGIDNISEHSDKTLDIKQGSCVITVNLGAMRTLILRSKSTMDTMISHENVEGKTDTILRDIQKIRLPHRSIFVLGWNTNRKYTHSIKPDKRRMIEKSVEEAAYDCQRISITFRTIATFYDSINGCLVGQGAPKVSQRIHTTEEIDEDYQQLIHAFSAENKQGATFIPSNIISLLLLPFSSFSSFVVFNNNLFVSSLFFLCCVVVYN